MNFNLTKSLALLLMLMTGTDVLHAKVTLPSIFSDNMVLQQKTDAAVWGKASPGEEVTVSTSWSAKTYTCKAGDDGKWKLYVKTPKACTGQWVCVEGENKLRISYLAHKVVELARLVLRKGKLRNGMRNVLACNGLRKPKKVVGLLVAHCDEPVVIFRTGAKHSHREDNYCCYQFI